MVRSIAHRGPDDEGVWLNACQGIALGHRRLSIIDLSPAGHQPMESPCGRYVIVFNGEIYNHLELRGRLTENAPLAWRGHSDTETLLAAVSAWGLAGALRESIGMFALALWDRQERCLFLARDRLGEKPLYYGWQGKLFLFGSELKALRAHPGFHAEIDRNAVALQLRYSCVPCPYSIYREIRKLPAGTWMRVNGPSREPDPVPQAYWSLLEVAERGLREPFGGSPQEAIRELEERLRQAITGQMVADVPLGAFLSGGVDSSAVVALMQASSRRPVKTFTIGFGEAAFNEAVHARAVADHLGSDHTELYVTAEQAREVIPRLPHLYDEPFSDSSQIPTCLVARLTRQHVAVSLSGDGGDELFGGYNRYLVAKRILERLRGVPRPMRTAAAALICRFSPRAWDAALAPLQRLLPWGLRVEQAGDKLQKLAHVLRASSRDDIYRSLTSHWDDSSAIVIGAREPQTLVGSEGSLPGISEFEHQMMLVDARTYLPDDVLVKVDRAAMGVSLETRVPFLDHRVVEFAWRLPLELKIRPGQGKWILRQVLYRYVPKALIERPKMGFGVPLDDWLRGPLRDWAEALLDERRLRADGLLRPEAIRRKWDEHLRGRRNWQYHLWDVLMFQAWKETRT